MSLPFGATWRVQAGECGRMPDGSQVGRSAPTMLLTLPNVITFAPAVRRAAGGLAGDGAPVRRQAFFLFLAAGLSDAVDGWLARRNGGGNSVGALLDPVADKALLVSMYVTLAAVKVLPDWLAILVVFRDVVIVGGVVVLSLLGQSVLIRPLYVSKLNTALQIVLVAVSLLLSGFGLAAPACCWRWSGWSPRPPWAPARPMSGSRPAADDRSTGERPPPRAADLVRRGGAAARPGDARPAGGAGGRAAGGGVARAAAVRLGAGAVRRRRPASPMCSTRRPRG